MQEDPSHWRGIIVSPPCYSESSGRLAHEFSSETPKAIDWADCRRYSIADYEVSFWFVMIIRINIIIIVIIVRIDIMNIN